MNLFLFHNWKTGDFIPPDSYRDHNWNFVFIKLQSRNCETGITK
jgi:hypothetical protein